MYTSAHVMENCGGVRCGNYQLLITPTFSLAISLGTNEFGHNITLVLLYYSKSKYPEILITKQV
jgi:hypothetical protein